MSRSPLTLAATLAVLAVLLWSATGCALAQTSARITDYGTDKDTYRGGETATGYLTVENTGSAPISSVSAAVTVFGDVPLLGHTSLFTKDIAVPDSRVAPGETKRFTFSVPVPAEYGGMSTAGNYDLQIAVKADGRDLGGFTKAVTVT